MAPTCSCAASNVLFTLAISQFIALLAPLRISLSTLAVMMSMAAAGAPIFVRKSSMCSDCLKYRSASAPRRMERGRNPISSISACTSRLAGT